MRKFLRKLEALFAATAFAEEGEVETARELAAEPDCPAPASPGAAEPIAPRAPARPSRVVAPTKVSRLP